MLGWRKLCGSGDVSDELGSIEAKQSVAAHIKLQSFTSRADSGPRGERSVQADQDGPYWIRGALIQRKCSWSESSEERPLYVTFLSRCAELHCAVAADMVAMMALKGGNFWGVCKWRLAIGWDSGQRLAHWSSGGGFQRLGKVAAAQRCWTWHA